MKKIARARRPVPPLLLAALAAAAISVSAAGPAGAAATGWLQSKGARIRIVATPPDSEGVIRAAVDIDLKPGWTTYWRNPGESGIPPQLDTAGSRNVASARLDFPPPVALDEGGVTAIGYDAPIALPLTIRQAKTGQDTLLDARLFIGVCKDICIPVNGDFSLDIPAVAKPESSIASVVVAKAFASLPGPQGDSFGVRRVSLSKDGQALVVTARLPAGTSAGGAPQLFVAGPEGWSFAPGRLQERQGDSATFLVPVTAKPGNAAAGPTLILVVRDGWRSIETTKTLR